MEMYTSNEYVSDGYMTMSDGETTYLWGTPLDWCCLEAEARDAAEEEAEEPVPGIDPFSDLDDESARLIKEELWGRDAG